MDDDVIAPDEAKVFLSYSRKDRERASGIADALRARHFGVFKDTDDILPTEEWKARLEELIEEADTIVFLLSPHSATSEVCAWEVEYATALNKRIAPIVIEDVEGDAIPPLLARLNFIFCTPRDPFENAVDTLASALSTDIDWIREHTRLAGLARRWENAGRPARLLLRGQDIADAEGWRDERPKEAPEIAPPQAALIAESRRAAGRRQRNWITGSLAAAAGAAALAVFAYFQSLEADRQRAEAEAQRGVAEERLKASLINESRFLARRAVERAEAGDQPSALRFALMGLPGSGRDRPLTAEAESALRLALSDYKRIAYLPPVKGNERADRILSGDGAFSASFDGLGRIRATRLADMATVVNEDLGAAMAFMSFAPGGRVVSVFHQDEFGFDSRKTVSVWDLATGARIFSTSSTGNYAVSPDGSLLVMAPGDEVGGGLKVFSTATGEVIGRIDPTKARFSNIAFSPDGRHILYQDGGGGTDGDRRIADPVTFAHKPLPTVEKDPDWWAEWAPEGATLISKGGAPNAVSFRVWRPPFDAPEKTIPVVDENAQDQLRFPPDLSLAVYSDGRGKRTYVADAGTGEPAMTFNGYRLTRFFPGGGAFVAYWGDEWNAEIYSVARRARIGVLDAADGVGEVVISPDGKRLIGRDGDGGVHVWAIPERLSDPDAPGRAFSLIVQGLEFAPEGDRLLAHADYYKQALMADVSTAPAPGRGTHPPGDWELARPECPAGRQLERLFELRGGSADFSALSGQDCSGDVAVSADGAIAVAATGRALLVFPAKEGMKVARFPLPPGFLTRPLISHDGARVLVTPRSNTANGGMALFDIVEGREIPMEKAGELDTISTGRAVFTSDGRRIIAPTRQGLTIWSAETGAVIGEVPPQNLRVDPDFGFRATDFHLFKDDRRILLKDFSTAWIVDIETGEVVNDALSDVSLQYFAVSPDESLIAGGGFGGPDVRVWSIADGALRARLAGFAPSSVSGDNGVTAIAFSSDGEMIAAGSAAGKVRVWSYPKSVEGLIRAAEALASGAASEEALDVYGE